jgi:hypothetical protein
VVLNDCQSTISRVKIQATCYDFNGNALDDDSVTVRNIEPGAKATFQVTVNASRSETAYCEPEVTSAKFK